MYNVRYGTYFYCFSYLFAYCTVHAITIGIVSRAVFSTTAIDSFPFVS